MKNRKKYIKAIHRVLKNRKWIVAYVNDEPVVFHENDLSKVTESNGFIKLLEIARFTKLDKALVHMKKVIEELIDRRNNAVY